MRFFRKSVRDPAWGLEVGDVLGFDLPTGGVARLQVVDSQAPDKEYDYRRLTVRVMEPGDLDLTSGDGNDSVVPVGAGATMGRGPRDFFAADLPSVLGPAATPGLVVLVPDDEGGAAEDPAVAGFRLVEKGAPPAQANGYAVLMEWDRFAQRLRTARPA